MLSFFPLRLRSRLHILLLLLVLSQASQAQRRFLDLSAYKIVFEDDFRTAAFNFKNEVPGSLWQVDQFGYWDPKMVCSDYGPASYAFRFSDIELIPDPNEPGDSFLALNYVYHDPPLRQIRSTGGDVLEGTFYKTSGFVRALYNGDTTCRIPGFLYGIFELRCRVPDTDGLQAAVWLWNLIDACEPRPEGWKPFDGHEVDFFETYRNGNNRAFFSTLHPTPSTGREGSSLNAPPNFDPADGFHTYTCVWSPTDLVWYLDGRYLYRFPKNDPDIPHSEMHLRISAHYLWDCQKNYHCDTKPDGTPNTNQACPQPNDPFLIDYVRVYKPTVMPPAGTPWPEYSVRRRTKKAKNRPTAATAATQP